MVEVRGMRRRDGRREKKNNMKGETRKGEREMVGGQKREWWKRWR